MTANRSVNAALMKQSRFNIVKKDFRLNWSLYLLVLPVLAFYIIFCYKPMYGIIIAFENYSPGIYTLRLHKPMMNFTEIL